MKSDFTRFPGIWGDTEMDQTSLGSVFEKMQSLRLVVTATQ